MKALLLFPVLALPVMAFGAPAATPVPDKPRVLIEEIKPLEDKRRIIVPVKVEAKIQSLVTSEIEAHVTRVLRPLGSSVKAGEVVLYLQNKDPGFTYAAVPVRAPISGVISQFWITQMAKAGRGDKLFTVIDPKSLKLSAEFPSGDLSVVTAGLPGEFRMSSQKDVKLGVRVTGISPLLDARTGTASADLEFTKTNASLPPIGSVGQATFEIDQGKILMIPEASVTYQDGKPMVRVLKGENQFTKKSIELGEQRDNSYVVKSGIGNGDKVVVRSSRPLKEGDLLEIDDTQKKETKTQ